MQIKMSKNDNMMISTPFLSSCLKMALRGQKAISDVSGDYGKMDAIKKEFDRDVKAASHFLKTPCREVALYKEKFGMDIADSPENLKQLSVALWGSEKRPAIY